MSTVTLDSYVIVGADGAVIHGIPLPPSAKTENKILVEINDVILPAGKAPPRHENLIMLYGNRDAREEMAFQRKVAIQRDPQVSFHPVSITFDIGFLAPHMVPIKSVPAHRNDEGEEIEAVVGVEDLRFLNLARSLREVQELIAERFRGYIEEEGGQVDGNLKRLQLIAQRPDLFGRLLTEKPFDKLEVIVFPINTARGLRQFAMVNKRSTRGDVIQNDAATIQAKAPEWLN